MLDPPEDPRIEFEVAEQYMRYISGHLEQHCERRDYDALILCAEGSLMKILDGCLEGCARKRVIGRVDLDLYEVNESDLISYVKDILERAGLPVRTAA